MSYIVAKNCFITYHVYTNDNDKPESIEIIVIHNGNSQYFTLGYEEKYINEITNFIDNKGKKLDIDVENGGPSIHIGDATIKLGYHFCEFGLTVSLPLDRTEN